MNDQWHSYKSIIWKRFLMYAWLWIDRYMFVWDVTETWRIAEKSFEFFSKIRNGYTNKKALEITSGK